nr:alpha/beta fold hydrolase [Streptomyces sp. Alain-F2R5]
MPIDAVYEPGATARDASDLVFVVAHGFTGDADRPHVRRIAEAFARHGAVVTFSFRGHGASGGRSTVGDREVLDLAAAVTWARGFGHARVVTVGFSMGGSVVLRHAALYADDGEAGTDAVVSVSAPARWYYRGTAPMRRLHWLVMRPRRAPGGALRHADPYPSPGLGPGAAVAGGGGAPDRTEAAARRARRPGRLLSPRPPPDAGRGGR